MNSKIIFTQAGVFRLQQLAGLIYRHTGVRHKLSNQQGQMALLHAATQSKHPDVQACCMHLADELYPHQLIALSTLGIRLTPSSVLAHKAG